MKYLLILMLLISCGKPIKDVEEPKQEAPVVVKVPIKLFQKLKSGDCYRYPNKDQLDVYLKVITVYSNDDIMGEFIIDKEYFKDMHDFSQNPRHLKKIDCRMYDDMRLMSTEWQEKTDNG